MAQFLKEQFQLVNNTIYCKILIFWLVLSFNQLNVSVIDWGSLEIYFFYTAQLDTQVVKRSFAISVVPPMKSYHIYIHLQKIFLTEANTAFKIGAELRKQENGLDCNVLWVQWTKKGSK